MHMNRLGHQTCTATAENWGFQDVLGGGLYANYRLTFKVLKSMLQEKPKKYLPENLL